MIIGVHGLKGSGKDEFFTAIKSIDKTYTKTAFAIPIRDEVSKIFNIDTEEQYDEFKRSEFMYQGHSVLGREIVRGIGMLMRGYDENQFTQFVQKFYRTHDNVVITDVRFENEMKMLKNDGIILVKIKRNCSREDGHISEVDMDDDRFDYVIENNGTLEEFHNNSKQLYKQIKEKHDTYML